MLLSNSSTGSSGNLGLSVREQTNYEGMRNQHPPHKIALQHKMSAR